MPSLAPSLACPADVCRIYLYIKTIERAHMPNKMWQKIRLKKSYAEALAQVWSGVLAAHAICGSQGLRLVLPGVRQTCNGCVLCARSRLVAAAAHCAARGQICAARGQACLALMPHSHNEAC